MANIVEMPKLGFDMAEGTLVKWVKSEQDKVKKGEVLAEIETDKATVEVESSFTGVLHKHLAEEGEALPVGSPIAVIAEEGEDVDLDALLEETGAEEKKKEEKEEKKEGKEKEEKEKAGKEAEAEKKPEKGEKQKEEEMGAGEEDFIKASPVAKRIADEEGIKLSNLEGTGPGGRIVKRDVEKAIEEGVPEEKPEKAKITPGKDETFEISKLRAAIGNRMQGSWQEIPHFFITTEYDVGEMLKTRKQLNRELPDEEKVSVNDFIIRASALALKEYPNLNASISGKELTRHGDINIGVAVAVENGLLTVVVKNADQKPLRQISVEAKAMIERVKEGKVRNEDIEGSTFTISNLGMYNVEDFVAIINPPEAAILAIGTAKEVPIVEDGELGIGWRMKCTLSADHRITDGAEAAEFMQHLSLFLEQPWRLFA